VVREVRSLDPSGPNSVPDPTSWSCPSFHASTPLPKQQGDAVLTSVLAKPGQIVDVPLVSSACRGTNVLETDCLDSAGEPDCQLMLLRKEVIQPHLPVRLPCYDFVPIARPTFDSSLPKVGPLASGVANFRDVTGGVYKARERIHRSVADLRLLATPTSWGRVADPNPN